MNFHIETLNQWGGGFLNFAWPMLWQSSLLIALVFVLDWLLARKLRASVRYALWLTVLVKLLLPPTLAVPTGAGWWLFRQPAIIAPVAKFTVIHGEVTPPAQFIPHSFPPAVKPELDGAAYALLAFMAISATLFVWLLVRWRQLHRKICHASPAAEFTVGLDNALRVSGVRSRVTVKIVDGYLSPAVCGLIKPVILLPRILIEKLAAEQLHAVLLHELFHHRRKDVWVNCAQTFLQIFYWWHPLLWLANARIRRVREEAVDDAVMLALRDEPDLYAPTLLEVAKLAFYRPRLSVGLVGIMESRSALGQRIERLVNFRAPRKAGLTIVSIFWILAFVAVAVPMGGAPAQTQTENVAAPPNSTKTNLEMRVFTVDRRIFPDALRKASGINSTNISTIAKILFGRSGVNWDFPKDKSISYNDQRGLLFVKATERDFDMIEQVVGALADPGPQVHIKARFIEIPVGSINFGTNDPDNFSAIMDDAYFRTIWKKLESTHGVKMLAEPGVVTTGGRQTQVRATDRQIILTNFSFDEISNKGYVTAQEGVFWIGPVLDIVPGVSADRHTIRLQATASVTNFLGYGPTNPVTAYTKEGKKFQLARVKYDMCVLKASANSDLSDNQTVVLKLSKQFYSNGAEVDAVPDNMRDDSEDKEVLVFITVTLVDAAGNRIHPNDESYYKYPAPDPTAY
ncbi:MAG TPA: M56 family metallopeptidase [Verrucomicrobiae bacterium]|jgi:beta-lactamase regulating signal transducer with metallopeptidase domain